MPQHQARLKAVHRIFRNDGLRRLDLNFRQLCRLLIQSIGTGRDTGGDKAGDELILFIDDIKGIGCTIVDDDGRTAIDLICSR